MKKAGTLAGAVGTLILLIGCAALPLSTVSGESETASAHSGDFPSSSTSDQSSPSFDSSVSSSAEPVSEPVLNEALLSLLGSDNSTLRQYRSGRCHARLTMRGTLQLTWFSPYFSIQFAPLRDSAAGWLEGSTAGFCEENPFVDDLSILQIDLCEVIDPQIPSLEQQPSLRQLIQTDETITYAFLCEALQQTPELSHTESVFYDAAHVSGDPAAQTVDAEHDHRIGQKINGGEYTAAFFVDDVQIRVSFILSQEEYLAYGISLEKTVE